MNLNAKIGVLWIFLVILGCDTSLYHSQGGATQLSLCDRDREFTQDILLTMFVRDLRTHARMRDPSENLMPPATTFAEA